MSISLGIAGLACLALALGHALTGRVVVPSLPRDLPSTRFGDGRYTRGLFRFTWHALTVMLATTGSILIALAYRPSGGAPVVVSLVGAAYATALVVLLWMTRRRPSDLLRIPVWTGFVLIIALCWINA